MEAARHYLEEDVWEEQHETFDEVSDTSEDEQSLDTQDMDAEVETDPNDDESETESCCLQGQPQRLQEHLQLRTSEGTADLNGRGAVHEQLPVGTIIDRCYKITGIIGKGSFGAAYAAEHLDSGLQVVIKARVSTSGTEFSESLKHELNIYMALNEQGPLDGIPCLYSAGLHKLSPSSASTGKQPVCVSYLAIQRFGPSIWTHCHKEHSTRHRQCDLSMQDLLNYSTGMLKALAAVHSRGHMHKDVKTDNFCMNLEPHRTTSIYAIDYGFGRRAFGDYHYLQYVEWEASFWGTPNYASLNSLLRVPQTPRDDLEALLYCVMELEQSDYRLPWNLTTNASAAAGWSDEKLERMSREKYRIWQQLCQEGLVPDYLEAYFNYITELQPWHCPDYQYLLSLLQIGISGGALPPRPKPQVYKAWPQDDQYNHQEVTQALLQELHAAASVVLPEAPGAAISTELQLQLDEQQDEQVQAAGRLPDQRYAAEVQAPAPVDAAGAFQGAFGGKAAWFTTEDAKETNSDAVQRFKRQRVTGAAVGVGVLDLTGPSGAWPAAAAVGVFEGSQSQPEE